MLESLFGSRTRVKLLRLFLSHSEQRWFVRELTRVVQEQINSVRRELGHLEQLGLITSAQEQRKKYYRVNTNFTLYPELKALFIKARVTLEKDVIEKLCRAAKVRYVSLHGYFVDDTDSVVDLFVIGDMTERQLQQLLDDFKQQFGRELRYTHMTLAEYKYRHDVTDKFLFNILHSKHIVLFDQLTK
ncbi:MAG: winged helix-turn-helix domain-containing protein [Patescibacteria group bacterium]|jgi:predicted transcriptional regulator